MTPSKLRDSTTRAAFDCHPTLGWFGSTSSWSGSASASALPLARSAHTGLLQTGLTGKDGLDAGCFVTVVNRLDDPLCDLRVTFIHHLDGVGPTRPMRGESEFRCTAEPQTASCQRQRCRDLR